MQKKSAVLGSFIAGAATLVGGQASAGLFDLPIKTSIAPISTSPNGAGVFVINDPKNNRTTAVTISGKPDNDGTIIPDVIVGVMDTVQADNNSQPHKVHVDMTFVYDAGKVRETKPMRLFVDNIEETRSNPGYGQILTAETAFAKLAGDAATQTAEYLKKHEGTAVACINPTTAVVGVKDGDISMILKSVSEKGEPKFYGLVLNHGKPTDLSFSAAEGMPATTIAPVREIIDKGRYSLKQCANTKKYFGHEYN